MKNNIVDFNFKTYTFDTDSNIIDIKKHYLKVFKKYFKSIGYNNSINLKIYNLKYSPMKEVSSVEYGDDEDYTETYRNILTNNDSYFVKLTGTPTLNDELFSFYIYPQNNCCGAMTCSATTIKYDLRGNKLGVILQYLKQDIAILNRVGLLTCTDIYYLKEKGNTKLEDLKPYLPNTKVLLNTDWEVSKLFFNKKSNNVVGVFTKYIPQCSIYNNFEINYNNSINLKIKLNNSQRQLSTIEDVTIGCDPELFLKSKDTQEFVPSFYVMKGDKNNPTPISDEGHSIQCDNVMVEYNIPPCKTAEEFVKHNLFVQDYIKTKVAEPNNLETVIFPTAKFTKANLKDDRALHMGCDPDYNAFDNGKPNPIVRASSNLRTGAGHIHIGYKNHNYNTNILLAQVIDLFLSIPLILMEPDNDRKTMYGKAGAYRNQKHGLEVRTTSNYIFSSPELMTWAFNQVKEAIDYYNSNKGSIYLREDIESTINTQDSKKAKEILKYYKIKTLLPNKLAISLNN